MYLQAFKSVRWLESNIFLIRPFGDQCLNAICDVVMTYPLFYKKAGHTMAMGAWMDR